MIETLNSVSFATLASEWMMVKRREEEAKALRYEIEAQLLRFLPEMPSEGQRTMKQEGFKMTAKADLNVSTKKYEDFMQALLEGRVPESVVKTVLYDTGVKRLRRLAMQQDPEALQQYSDLLPLIEITPAKVGVSVVRYE